MYQVELKTNVEIQQFTIKEVWDNEVRIECHVRLHPAGKWTPKPQELVLSFPAHPDSLKELLSLVQENIGKGLEKITTAESLNY